VRNTLSEELSDGPVLIVVAYVLVAYVEVVVPVWELLLLSPLLLLSS